MFEGRNPSRKTGENSKVLFFVDSSIAVFDEGVVEVEVLFFSTSSAVRESVEVVVEFQNHGFAGSAEIQQ